VSSITTAVASRQGTRAYYSDAPVVHRLPHSEVVAAAIVDGIGSSAEVAEFAQLAAQVAARVGARKTARLGVLAAAELVEAPGGTDIEPDGVAVLAVLAPDGVVSVAWTGDSRAYAWRDGELVQLTGDMTIGTYLRSNGFPLPDDAPHDNWLATSLGRSSVATVHHIRSETDLLVLTSDGVHKQTAHERMAEIVAAHADHPQALADELVAAAGTDADGYRDDATAVVLRTA
jgi:PPM family protein phosphatase